MTDRPTPPSDRPAQDKSRFAWRSVHRDKAHEAAHDDSPQTALAPVTEHPLVPSGAAPLVATDADLAALLGRLRHAEVVAYDTEFIGELTYHPKLCVLQVATSSEVALIDPLADLDLRPFWELLADPAVPKVVHAGSQDVEPVVRHLGRGPANVFDTQIAAGMASFPYPVSLSKLVQEATGVRLGKGLTFTHWDQRPLSGQQLRYAADDVRYLPLLYAELKKRLSERGYLEWVHEECDAMCEPTQYKFDPDVQWLRIKGSGTLDAKHAGVLRQLVIWRDQSAREADVPPRSFLRDEILIDLSKSPVRSMDRFERVKGLPRQVERNFGQTIIELTQRGLGEPPANMPELSNIEPSPSDKYKADALCASAQSICFAKRIDPALAGSRADFTELFFRLRDGQPPDDLKVMTGWRRQAVGDDLCSLFRGEMRVSFAWKDGPVTA